MKVVLINDNHQRTGGAEHYFFDLKQRLKNTADIEVFSIGFGSHFETGDDYQVFPGPQSKIAKLFWRVMPQPFLYFRLRRLLKKINPDVVHLHNIKQYSLTVLGSLTTFPVVQTIHDYGAVCPVAYNVHRDDQPCKTGLRWRCLWQHRVKFTLPSYLVLTATFLLVKAKMRKTASLFLTPSPQLADYLRQNKFSPVEHIMPFQSFPAEHSFLKCNPNHFLFVGNLAKGKGIFLLLEEFALAVKLNSNLTLSIVGKGNEDEALKHKVSQLNLRTHVQFVGWQTQLEKYYAECAALIFPSLWMESFGLVITEAMSHGRPVIGSNHDTTQWLIDDNRTGLIFNPLRKGDLAEKILQIAGNKETIEKFGNNGRSKIKNMINNEESLKKILNGYRSVIKKG